MSQHTIFRYISNITCVYIILSKVNHLALDPNDNTSVRHASKYRYRSFLVSFISSYSNNQTRLLKEINRYIVSQKYKNLGFNKNSQGIAPPCQNHQYSLGIIDGFGGRRARSSLFRVFLQKCEFTGI